VSDICTTKWHDAFFNGIITDIPADQFDKVIKFNTDLVEGAKGKLAPVNRTTSEWTALRGNHSTSGHRAVIARCEHPDETITEDGKLSPVKVLAKCPSLEPILMVGASFTVIPHWFLKQYPGLKMVIISSGNVINNVAQAERDLQVLCKVGQKVSVAASFEEIHKTLNEQRFRNMEAIPGMFHFCRKFCNGGELLMQSQNYLREAAVEPRHLDAQVWDVPIGLY
jgi:hypothetical protein